MKLTFRNILSIVVLLILIPLIFVSCAGDHAPTSQVPTNTAESVEVGSEPTEATSNPAVIFLSGSLPVGSVDLDALSSLTLSTSPDADLWFGPLAEAPEGDVILTSTWVYALAAPFPTLVDGVTLADLQAYWSGETVTDMLSVPYLKIPSALAKIWETQWGELDASRIIISDDPVDADRLWESNAWAIVPFDSLEPKLKVIFVDETSPLNKDFDPATAPLVVSFQLIARTEAGQALSAEDLETLNTAIAVTNRDLRK